MATQNAMRVQEWLTLLPHPYQMRALMNMEVAKRIGYMGPVKYEMRSALRTAFNFRRTPEGYKFWHQLAEGYNFGDPLPDIPTSDMHARMPKDTYAVVDPYEALSQTQMDHLDMATIGKTWLYHGKAIFCYHFPGSTSSEFIALIPQSMIPKLNPIQVQDIEADRVIFASPTRIKMGGFFMK
jgi:hypothetical protein